jgi:hypothetical protein
VTVATLKPNIQRGKTDYRSGSVKTQPTPKIITTPIKKIKRGVEQ